MNATEPVRRSARVERNTKETRIAVQVSLDRTAPEVHEAVGRLRLATGDAAEAEAAYREALASHRRTLRQAFAAHSGYEVDESGDGLFYAFAAASLVLTNGSTAIDGRSAAAVAGDLSAAAAACGDTAGSGCSVKR